MPTTITRKKATDKSTFPITVKLNDGDTPPQPLTPKSVTWTLTNIEGRIINNREEQAVTPPASEFEVVLFGDDLNYGDGAERVLLIEAVYDSDQGSDLPLRDQCRFEIENLVGVV